MTDQWTGTDLVMMERYKGESVVIKNIIEKTFSDGSKIQACWDFAPRDCNYVMFSGGRYDWLKVSDDGVEKYIDGGDYGDWEQVNNPFEIVQIMQNAYERPWGV